MSKHAALHNPANDLRDRLMKDIAIRGKHRVPAHADLTIEEITDHTESPAK
ncbi:hypothetical protein [Timonella senegalensis]|uniref:hypothetical protein n=1 Tax=Timonella senegalensis TaxID=1465825 RepID=UPI00031075F4|nr:hypothetical protein [Timonella senegalensis]